LKSGTIISHGKQFLKEHWQKQPTLFRMQSQLSQAHISAVDIVEK
jgi:ribosomal protein L16 Arg81 hydroxylase